jgi:hypothetical protein
VNAAPAPGTHSASGTAKFPSRPGNDGKSRPRNRQRGDQKKYYQQRADAQLGCPMPSAPAAESRSAGSAAHDPSSSPDRESSRRRRRRRQSPAWAREGAGESWSRGPVRSAPVEYEPRDRAPSRGGGGGGGGEGGGAGGGGGWGGGGGGGGRAPRGAAARRDARAAVRRALEPAALPAQRVDAVGEAAKDPLPAGPGFSAPPTAVRRRPSLASAHPCVVHRDLDACCAGVLGGRSPVPLCRRSTRPGSWARRHTAARPTNSRNGHPRRGSRALRSAAARPRSGERPRLDAVARGAQQLGPGAIQLLAPARATAGSSCRLRGDSLEPAARRPPCSLSPSRSVARRRFASDEPGGRVADTISRPAGRRPRPACIARWRGPAARPAAIDWTSSRSRQRGAKSPWTIAGGRGPSAAVDVGGLSRPARQGVRRPGLRRPNRRRGRTIRKSGNPPSMR